MPGRSSFLRAATIITWGSTYGTARARRAPPADAVGLRHYSIVLPNLAEFQTVAGGLQEAGVASEEMDEGLLLRDPSQNGVLLTHRAA